MQNVKQHVYLILSQIYIDIHCCLFFAQHSFSTYNFSQENTIVTVAIISYA